jgi:hypothetical protein
MTAERKSMQLIGWRPIRKGGLRGFAAVRLPNGLVLIDCPVCRASNGRFFASLPSKPVLDESGQHAKPNGKALYTPMARWPSKDVNTAWGDRVVQLVRAAHPADLD